MKSAIIAGVFAATAAMGQTIKQSEPFFLKVTSSNLTIDGKFLYSCHAGAALQTLCLGSRDVPTTNVNSATFYLNTTVYEGKESDTGNLIWNLVLAPGADGSQQIVSEPLTFQYTPGSNVAITWFAPGYPTQPEVGFNNSALFVNSYPDDSHFTDTYPEQFTSTRISNWYACWVLAGSYYYNALSWVTAGAPHNPTCQSVSVIKVDVSA
ncbi:hypothetical protein QBC47DRAFT_379383 [Echria macrotheca]|uniref:DUF7907 domain-containing protein n=1 Tax=Echria macrotheca TaxID=438768 RepID=A0AAJ0BDU5_9PEZI|nr:hypothetical protein QBC47DRAFT_379383 [Echria macrotheca]